MRVCTGRQARRAARAPGAPGRPTDRVIPRSIPTSTARRTRSSSQSIRSSPNSLLSGCPPELADPIGAVEVGETQDVDQFGASRRREGLEVLSEQACIRTTRHAENVAGAPDRVLSPRGLHHVWPERKYLIVTQSSTFGYARPDDGAYIAYRRGIPR